MCSPMGLMKCQARGEDDRKCARRSPCASRQHRRTPAQPPVAARSIRARRPLSPRRQPHRPAAAARLLRWHNMRAYTPQRRVCGGGKNRQRNDAGIAASPKKPGSWWRKKGRERNFFVGMTPYIYPKRRAVFVAQRGESEGRRKGAWFTVLGVLLSVAGKAWGRGGGGGGHTARRGSMCISQSKRSGKVGVCAAMRHQGAVEKV